MVKIIFDYKPRKELIKYFALLLHTKNYIKRYRLPTPPKISKKTLRRFRRLLGEELGYYNPLSYLLFNKGLNKKEREKLDNILEKYDGIHKDYPQLLKKINTFKEKLEKLKPKIKRLLSYAENYTKIRFTPDKIIAIPIPYTNGASSLQFKKNLYTCFRAHQKSDVKKDRILYLILHECLHLLNLLSSNSKIAKEINKKYTKRHPMYGEYSNVINESFIEAIECRIAIRRGRISKKRLEFLKFGKTKLFFEQLRDNYEKNRKFKNIKYFGLDVVKNFLL